MAVSGETLNGYRKGDEMENKELQLKIDLMIGEQLFISRSDITEASRIEEDLGADSLDCVELLMAFEGEFNIEIPDEDVEKIKTVGDIYKYAQFKGWNC